MRPSSGPASVLPLRSTPALEELHLVLTHFGPLVIALDATSIRGVDKRVTRPDGSAVPAFDLAPLLGISTPDEQRHRLNIGSGAEAWDLVVGSGFRIERVSHRELQGLPRFLAGLEEKRGVVGLLARGERFAFVVELGRVHALVNPP